MRLLIGTRAGLFLLRGSQEWKRVRCSGPLLTRRAVGPLARTPAGAALAAVGDTLHISTDGARWQQLGKLPAGVRFWSLAPLEDALYAGAEPATLLRSYDAGRTWLEVVSLRSHPSALEWWGPWQLPLTQAVIADPFRPPLLYVAISVAGIFRSGTAGANDQWEPLNEGIAPIFPRTAHHATIHRDVQNLAALRTSPPDADASTILIAATSHGLYRQQAGDKWEHVSGDWAPHGARALAVAQSRGAVYTVPLRDAANGQLAVWRSTDAGRTWQPLPASLPVETGGLVHRDALALGETAPDAPPALYVGTRDGDLYWSADDGHEWQVLARDLPSIRAVLPLDDDDTHGQPHRRGLFARG